MTLLAPPSPSISGISTHKWNDNGVIDTATNFDMVHLLHNVSCYSQEKKKKITVPQSTLIYTHNRFMDGIDHTDQNIVLYWTRNRGKKWHLPLLVHLIDLLEQNIWHVSRKEGNTWDHQTFPQNLTTSILQSNQHVIQSGWKSKTNDSVKPRFGGMNHFIISLEFRNGKKIQLHCKFVTRKQLQSV